MQRRPAGKHKGSRTKSQPGGLAAGRVRIIAGRWRGTRLEVPEVAGLRPSGDRVRETLFNYLQAWLPGACCLDLFAGSGALGFEAASRGAAQVVMVESHALAFDTMKRARERLKATNIDLVRADALQWLQDCTQSFDIIFVDPPFADELHQAVIDLIMLQAVLRPRGWLYVEAPQGAHLDAPDGLLMSRQKRIGEVTLALFQAAAQ